MNFILASIGVFLVTILLLVVILLVAKKYLSPSGNVNITINGDKTISVAQGGSVLSTLASEGIYLSSACGGKGSCGQCKCQVVEGGGEILDSEKGQFTRKQIKDHWRLGCQCKVKGDLKIKGARVCHGCEGVRMYGDQQQECGYVHQGVQGAASGWGTWTLSPVHTPRSRYLHLRWITTRISTKSLIGDEYLPAWQKFGLFPLKCVNPEPTVRAYSMANYPAEGDVFMLTVRIATPPFKADRSGFHGCEPGYCFFLHLHAETG